MRRRRVAWALLKALNTRKRKGRRGGGGTPGERNAQSAVLDALWKEGGSKKKRSDVGNRAVYLR